MMQYIVGETVLVVPFDKLSDHCIAYNDARSAAFYAMGLSMKEKQPVTLVVPGEYVSNVYTAITEAWFQKVNVVIVAVYGKVSDVQTQWIDRCVRLNVTASTEEDCTIKDFFEKAYTLKGPALLNYICGTKDEKKHDYTRIIHFLDDVYKQKIEYWCYAPNGNYGRSNIHSIDSKYKYGIVSKYIGMSATENAGILICDSDCVLVDVNIFRTRYANENMKIIILDDGKLQDNKVQGWIESNDWQCKCVDEITQEDARWLLQQEKQTVLIEVSVED